MNYKMDIKTFKPEDLDLTNQPVDYSCPAYEESFPLLPTPLGGRRYIAKLASLPKPIIRTHIHRFLETLPENGSIEGFLDTPEFYQDPNYHQLYKFRMHWPNRKDLTSIYFHSQSQDKEVEKYLDTLQEAYILRSSVRGKKLDVKVQEDFPTQFQRFLQQIPNLAQQDIPELQGFTEEQYKRDHINHYGSILFTALSIMKRQGQNSNQTLQIASRIKEGSPFIFKAVRNCF